MIFIPNENHLPAYISLSRQAWSYVNHLIQCLNLKSGKAIPFGRWFRRMKFEMHLCGQASASAPKEKGVHWLVNHQPENGDVQESVENNAWPHLPRPYSAWRPHCPLGRTFHGGHKVGFGASHFSVIYLGLVLYILCMRRSVKLNAGNYRFDLKRGLLFKTFLLASAPDLLLQSLIRLSLYRQGCTLLDARQPQDMALESLRFVHTPRSPRARFPIQFLRRFPQLCSCHRNWNWYFELDQPCRLGSSGISSILCHTEQ